MNNDKKASVQQKVNAIVTSSISVQAKSGMLMALIEELVDWECHTSFENGYLAGHKGWERN